MNGLFDFFSPQAGQRRRAALDEFGRYIGYYVPPELRGLLGLAAEMSPTATVDRAATASMRAADPSRTASQRIGDVGNMLSEVAGVVGPAAVANRAAMPAAQALQESLMGFSAGAQDVGRTVVDRLNQPGPVPTMYSNPVFAPFDVGGSSLARPTVDGTLGRSSAPVTLDGVDVSEWSPSDFGRFGEAYGVPNLGPLDDESWARSRVPFTTNSGREVLLPPEDQPLTYYDLLHLKSQAINPNDLPEDVHLRLHNQMVNAVSPTNLSDEQIANQILFGIISPNQPLTPNEMALGRIMVKGPEDLNNLAQMVPYRYTGEIPNMSERQAMSRDITRQLGLNAASEGGIGASGSANYTDMAEFAQKMQDRPDFFRFNPQAERYADMSDPEKWAAFVTEVMNETRGLSAKTGSLATVWQDPANAQISAIDRHMATLFTDEMFPSVQERDRWASNLINKFNDETGSNVSSLEELQATPGGRGAFVDAALAYVNRKQGVQTRNARTGEFNERVPEYLKQTPWVSAEPEKLGLIGSAYTRALEANAANAARDNQAIFPSQWMYWDRQRTRLEPHEVLFPGLERLPRMSQEQARAAAAAHSGAGYNAASGTVRPVALPGSLATFGLGGLGLLGYTAMQPEEEQY
jgi:hypothetical protein